MLLCLPSHPLVLNYFFKSLVGRGARLPFLRFHLRRTTFMHTFLSGLLQYSWKKNGVPLDSLNGSRVHAVCTL